jgi:hypothetical protein
MAVENELEEAKDEIAQLRHRLERVENTVASYMALLRRFTAGVSGSEMSHALQKHLAGLHLDLAEKHLEGK